MSHVTRMQAKQFIGHEIYALRKDGAVVHGKLKGLKGDRLMIAPASGQAHTQAILPLALFDILAIGTLPYAGFGGFGGYGGYGGFGGFGYPGFYW